jgi:hypothetical protein
MPLSALLIGQVSLVSPLATLTADFALAPLMLSGIFTILVGNLGAWAAAIPGLLVWIPSWWLVANAQLWASVPGAGIDASGVTFMHVLLYYGALSAMFVIFSNPERRARVARLTPSFSTALLGVAAVAIWATALVMALG